MRRRHNPQTYDVDSPNSVAAHTASLKLVTTIWEVDSDLLPTDYRTVSYEDAAYLLRTLWIYKMREVSPGVLVVWYDSAWMGAHITFVTHL